MFCKNGFLLAFGVLSLLGVLGICPVYGAGWKSLPGHVPREVDGLSAKGQLAVTNQLRLAISLPLRDRAGLENFLAQLYDPASPNYRQYLTPAEFTARFGPLPEIIGDVARNAAGHGYAAVKQFQERRAQLRRLGLL